MSYGPHTKNPWEHDESEPEDDTHFRCACGDPHCWGVGDDPQNIRLGSAWYAADCQMANHHPIVVADRARAARSDEARDDFNEVRR